MPVILVESHLLSTSYSFKDASESHALLCSFGVFNGRIHGVVFARGTLEEMTKRKAELTSEKRSSPPTTVYFSNFQIAFRKGELPMNQKTFRCFFSHSESSSFWWCDIQDNSESELWSNPEFVNEVTGDGLVDCRFIEEIKLFGWSGMTHNCLWCGEAIDEPYGFCNRISCCQQYAAGFARAGFYLQAAGEQFVACNSEYIVQLKEVKS
jgi:hypothetical protein